MKGFTLIELILVLVLIGILSVVALPKLGLISGGADIAEVHNRFKSLLRHTQLQAMQNTQDDCHRVGLNRVRFGQTTQCSNPNGIPQSFANSFLGLTLTERNDNIFIEFNDVNANRQFNIQFSPMGVPQADCAGGCSVTFENSQTGEERTVVIETQGYIH